MLASWRLELLLVLLALAFAWAYWFGGFGQQLGLGLAFAVVTGILAARWGRRLLRHLIWRLRNRLIVAYLFIAVIPFVLIVVLAMSTARQLGGQLAVHLVSSELERRYSSLLGAARTVARAPSERRQIILDRMETVYRERFPGMQIQLDESLTPADAETSGVVVRDGFLFIWARAQFQDRQVTFFAPITRRWLADLSPGLGDVSIIHFPDPGKPRQAIRLHGSPEPEDDEPPSVPKPANRMDLELLWASEIPIALWDTPRQSELALLSVHSRLSAVLNVLTAQQAESKVSVLIAFYAIIFAIVEVISIYIGVSLTRTITGAVNELYEGTERVKEGDFSHRIQVKGEDQIAELSRSFNTMTENVERLLRIAKESERMQAELEIARQVQAQLFPRSVPKLKSLELKAVCNPARTVSGDYFDYQMLPDGRLALALGDVAGKGISAALLMASLQASLRMQVREPSLTSSRLVGRINQHLHSNTAPEKYATFYFSLFDEEAGTLTYTNAGHLPPLLFRNGEVTPLDVNGMVVGAFPFAKYNESQVTLLPGDLLVGYTDGITEPENEYGEMFGEERLIDVVHKHSHLDHDHIINAVIDAVQQFTGSPELQDDMTLIVARRV
jgi:sigma-B regulation protein RsbU (phosphoserine phosphatase)